MVASQTAVNQLSSYGVARSTIQGAPLSDEETRKTHAFWRACNYLALGMIYLQDNPLLREPLKPEHIKTRMLGHWGASPALSFIYTHLNRVIRLRDLDMIFMAGPGHGAPGVLGPVYLEGSYSEIYPEKSQDTEGLARFFKEFSFPGGIGSHCTPETPGSIHEGGELGYVLSHACGAAFDNPDLIVAAVVGDGEAETGPLATSWHMNKFLSPIRDGAVLPILNLNGYKINNPTLLARISHEELESLFKGYGYTPCFVEGSDPQTMHQAMAATLDHCVQTIRSAQEQARSSATATRPRWPMIVLRTPKGWTAPSEVDGHKLEGLWRSHQVPLAGVKKNPAHLQLLEQWMRSYKPEELFDANGLLIAELRDLTPSGERRMGANPHANGGQLKKSLRLPDFRNYGVKFDKPGQLEAENTRPLGVFLRDVMKLNMDTFRVFGPDENTSNKLDAVYEVSKKFWIAEFFPEDQDGGELATDGRVIEMLSEHTLEGMFEGYVLTGRHGFLSTYEAFAHVIDSMFNQHAKWLSICNELPWRRRIASVNLLITSTVWRQDHNGFTHQDPGFIDHVVNKKAEIVRVYLPPDANCLLSVADHCLRSRHYVNVIVAGKQPALDYLSMDDAIVHCTRGIGIWEWASNDDTGEPDVVLGCCGDIPTLETLAAAAILRDRLPDLKVRVVNVVDLMRLQPDTEHPHGLSDVEFDALFTTDRPVVFAYHGYPWLVHRLTYRRTNHDNLHVRGYKEEGTTTTPFDMVMLNDLDRFHLVMDVIDRVPGLSDRCGRLRQDMVDERLRARMYTREHGEDAPETRDWTWPY
jgi:xylulose-5-phosphate/fructose-6-phosphate phosphoketolase